MNNERNNSEMKQNNGEVTTTATTETKTEEKRDKKDWIDHEHYTELGGEG